MSSYLVGVTGASGTIYALRLVEILSKISSVDVVVTREALKVSQYECLESEDLLRRLRLHAKNLYSEEEIEAPPSSSSYMVKLKGMAIVPCSLTTLAKISSGIADNLVTRSAVNALRLGKPLVLVIRETPLGVLELRNMLRAAVAGATVLPASPGFYGSPTTAMELVDFVTGKIMDALGVEHEIYRRWGGGEKATRDRNLCRQAYG